jgi:uncharacterized membrane protein
MAILIALTAAALGVLVAFVLPVLSFIRATRAASEAAALRARLAALEAQLTDVLASRHAAEASAVAPQAATPPASEDTGAPPTVIPPPMPAEPPPAQTPAEPSFAPPAPLSPIPDQAPAAFANATSPADRGERGDSGQEPGTTIGLEEVIGGRLLLYVGAVAVVLGAAFFLKYAFDREWITETMRVVLGAIAGTGLVAGGLRLGRSGYGLYGQVLTGGGLAVLYLAAYAAFGFYGLIGSAPAFALLTAVTACTALLADRQSSQPMAFMATGGGFLTPFLVGGSTDAQVTLFSYVIVLILGTLYLARRREWPLLNVFSYALTIVTVAAWADAFYSRAKYLRTEFFLTAFCALFLVALAHARRLGTFGSRVAALVLVSAPLLYHTVSLGILAPHGAAFLVYLIALTVIGIGWATGHAAPGIRLLLWFIVFLPLLAWIDVHQTRTWLAPSLAALGAVFALHLLAQMDRLTRRDGRLGAADLLLVHLNGLGLFTGVYILLERQAVEWVAAVGALLVAVHVAIAAWLRTRYFPAALHALAVAFALLAATVGVELDGAWLTAAWAAEGAAVISISLRLERDWFRAAGAVLMMVAAGRWIVLSVLQPVPAAFQLFANEPTALGVWLILLLYLLAWLHRSRGYPHTIAALVVSASVATVILLTTQNQAYWEIRGASYADASFASQLALSLVWALYGGILIAIGIRLGYTPIRYTAIALFGLTVVKVFLADLAGLQGIYRVLGLLAVGTILLVVSFLYQRRKLAAPVSDPSRSA